MDIVRCLHYKMEFKYVLARDKFFLLSQIGFTATPLITDRCNVRGKYSLSRIMVLQGIKNNVRHALQKKDILSEKKCNMI